MGQAGYGSVRKKQNYNRMQAPDPGSLQNTHQTNKDSRHCATGVCAMCWTFDTTAQNDDTYSLAVTLV